MERMWLSEDERLNTLARGAAAGALAGSIFAAVQVFASVVGGYGFTHPFRHAASVMLDRGAFTMPATLAVTLGFFIHYAISAAWGMVAGMLYEWPQMARRYELGVIPMVAAGLIFGAGVWLVDMAIVAQGLFPWMWRHEQMLQLAFHVVAFGAPLGAGLAVFARENPYARTYSRPLF